MVAGTELGFSTPIAHGASGPAAVPVRERRAVAVAVSAMELLRPESDLARLAESFGAVDLLVATEDVPAAAPAPIGMLDGSSHIAFTVGADGDEGDEGDNDDEGDDVHAGVAALGLHDVAVHRLGLRAPFGPGAEDDLVAALSELVGFDPEPGVYCLAPAPATLAADPARAAVGRAAQRIAQVYGIPLLRYRCLELSVVDDEE